MSTEKADCARWGNRALRRATEMSTERRIASDGGIRRASGGGRNVARCGGFQPLGKSSAPRRATEMRTCRRIPSAGGNQARVGRRRNVDRCVGLQPLGKSSALRRATERPTGRRIAAAWEIRRAPGDGGNVDRRGGLQPAGKSSALRRARKCELEGGLQPRVKSGARRTAGRTSTETADCSRRGNQSRPGCWRKCRPIGGISSCGVIESSTCGRNVDSGGGLRPIQNVDSVAHRRAVKC